MKLTFTLIVLCFSLELMAQKAGTFDSSFGVDGKALTLSLYCIGVAGQTDGSIIAAGNIWSEDSVGFFAIKYTHDGAIDTSFGINGRAYYSDNAGYAIAMAVQPDNKILVAGYHQEMFEPWYVSIVRFNADGTTDSSFGNNGNVISDPGRVYALAVQPDGKILAEGNDFEKVLTMRFLPDGTPDETFGINGKVENNFSNGGIGYTIAVQPDSKIVIGGRTGTSPFLARYTSSGTLDQSFGSAGKVIYSLSNADITDLTLQVDGKIVAVGSISLMLGDTLNSIVLRSMPDGTLDTGFGDSGINEHKFKTRSGLRSVVLQKDGKIVACGSITDLTGKVVHFLLERYTANGILDSSFINGGYQITTLDYIDAPYSVFLQKDEKIVLGGSSETPQFELEVGIARYNNDNQSKKQIIVQKIKHYIQTHNNPQATTLSNVSIYPNPAQNILHVEGLSSSQKTKLTVVDFNGNVAMSHELRAVSGVYNLNIASLHAGNYMLKIETNGEVVTKQFVKE